eukprot:scpid73538/ scgid30091/ PiggyBac transposable element-derived protein 4
MSLFRQLANSNTDSQHVLLLETSSSFSILTGDNKSVCRLPNNFITLGRYLKKRSTMAERQLTVEEADEVIHQLFEASSDEDDFEGFENVNVDSNESDSESDSEDEVPQPQAQEWAEVAVGQDRTDTRWLPDLVEKEPGPTFQTDDPATCTPVDTFQEFFSGTVVHNVVVETNRYAHQRLERLGDRYPQARIRQWQDVTRDEIFVLVLMILAMGTVQQPEMTNHWSEHWLLGTPGFAKVMSRNRFQLLVSCLHFINNSSAERDQNGVCKDKLYKIRKFMDRIVENFRTKYTLRKCVSIDEQMVAYKGRLSFKQYMPAKPIKWGMKAYVLAEADTGYVCDWHLYTGKDDSDLQSADTAKRTQLVMRLITNLQPGHIIYTDNYYTSPDLFTTLRGKKLGAVGTVRSNRRGLPAQMKKKMKKTDPTRHWRQGSLLAVAWFDKKQVNMVSTIHEAEMLDIAIRDRHSAGGHRHVKKPKCVDNYNSNMGGVDKCDQYVSYYRFPHRHQRWYLSIFHQLTEICVTNARVVFANITGHDMPLLEFRRKLLDGLLRR